VELSVFYRQSLLEKLETIDRTWIIATINFDDTFKGKFYGRIISIKKSCSKHKTRDFDSSLLFATQSTEIQDAD